MLTWSANYCVLYIRFIHNYIEVTLAAFTLSLCSDGSHLLLAELLASHAMCMHAFCATLSYLKYDKIGFRLPVRA